MAPQEEENTNEEHELVSKNCTSRGSKLRTLVDRQRSSWHGPKIRRKLIRTRNKSTVSNVPLHILVTYKSVVSNGCKNLFDENILREKCQEILQI